MFIFRRGRSSKLSILSTSIDYHEDFFDVPKYIFLGVKMIPSRMNGSAPVLLQKVSFCTNTWKLNSSPFSTPIELDPYLSLGVYSLVVFL